MSESEYKKEGTYRTASWDRNDRDGDLQNLVPADVVTVPVKVAELHNLVIALRGMARFEMAETVEEWIPKPRLVTVDLDELKAAWENSGVDQGLAWDALVARLEAQS